MQCCRKEGMTTTTMIYASREGVGVHALAPAQPPEANLLHATVIAMRLANEYSSPLHDPLTLLNTWCAGKATPLQTRCILAFLDLQHMLGLSTVTHSRLPLGSDSIQSGSLSGCNNGVDQAFNGHNFWDNVVTVLPPPIQNLKNRFLSTRY
jgi:hypothetical protein